MLSHYHTVKGHGKHEIIIQKSRFIAHVNRVTTEEEAQSFIQDIKKEHRDATHNCSAYLIGEDDRIQKANDDGEPNGTAGIPILEVLKKQSLKDTVVVVTRYFGGIKLGAGGLIRAYGKATSEALLSTGIVERKLVQIMHIKVDYTLLGKIENEIRFSSYQIKEIQYLDEVELLVYVGKENIKDFVDWVVNITNGKCKTALGEVTYLEKIL